MTKPKNRVYCPAIERSKMLFETQDKADRFIKFNEDDLRDKGTIKFKKLRSYYCEVCGGWHITHILLSKEEAEKLDNRIKSIVSKANKDIKRKEKENEDKYQDAYEFVKGINLSVFGSKKKLRKYLVQNPNIIPKHLDQSTVFHIIKEMPPEFFTGPEKSSNELSKDEIKELAQKLYSELPLSKLTDPKMIEDYIKWEYIYKQNIPIIVIKELKKLCGLY